MTLRPKPVVLADYDPAWPELARAYARDLAFLDDVVLAVHHFGSTAVPGLIAKPIIDLIVMVESLEALEARRADVEANGYGWHGEYGIKGRRFLTRDGANGERLVNIHMFQADSMEVMRHIAFRDYLCAHPQAAHAYAREKRRAQALHPGDSHKYADEKDAWIRIEELKALDWFAARRKVS
jgi:GrpB-like predicted nucleotidyltransferase (UPF0157 family)